MNGPVLRVAWYRFRATLHRRRSGYVALAVLTGLVGGVALASVVPARRTDSSYPDFLVLAGGLAAGAVAALGFTLNASIRRRRRDFALLKTIGFTRSQLAAAVAWQATVTAAIGLVIGIPLGIAAGRWLWVLFAHQLSAVPEPAVPVLSIALVALATLVLANVIAALPGRRAARTPAATVLRAE
jgi:predicted lysophospholipase L1 biosynthesis ABC-type transport system permease subunit